MEYKSVMKYHLGGYFTGIYLVEDEEFIGPVWVVINSKNNKAIRALTFEHASFIMDGCIEDIKTTVGVLA